ncbi:RNA polymerase sporulation sigma factor SigF [Oceanirhabdus sp. W0125-5]|uniref:RNA polymerase sporulation sigma factor SigF n=1 Tax=Oceanirhabdus sp. W0125-5 TaxID=2999116 RepID=UPI0022F2FB8A|nr:RNA polymerase sporulation sigma factor SigF [Oceanirhabdus sp. W0125-5]WBW99465.1 RNA polymerase sporulation sigma factor SigF [Oceanirhabdus sp. W0125-5]
MDKNYGNNLELIKEARKGNKEALDNIVQNNLPLVTSICKKFINRGYEYDDLFQIGCIGLVKAVSNFDDSYGVKFSTYAVPMIMGEIKRFFRDDGIIKVSRSVKKQARQLHYDREALTNELQRDPTVEELSEYSGISKEEVVFALESSAGMNYLYDTIHQDDGSPVLLIDKITCKKENSVKLIDKIALKEAIRQLDSRGRQVIILRYFKDKTQVQVAKMLGISQVQVSRIEKKVLGQIKEKISG